LFRHRYGVEPELIERTPDARTNYENMFEGVDAALVIGDPAMMVEANAKRLGLNIHDLAAEWQAMTDTPLSLRSGRCERMRSVRYNKRRR
jgi:predicted solute-binding protein